jgi:hypothetical protein
MTRVQAMGLAIELVRGWEAEIGPGAPAPGGAGVSAAGAAASAPPGPPAVLHAANFALPAGRSEYGAGAVEVMRVGHAFVALIEMGPHSLGTPLFDHPRPSGLVLADLADGQLQRPLPGQVGCQRFFTEGGRAFSLYVVLCGAVVNPLLLPRVNQVIGTITIDPA